MQPELSPEIYQYVLENVPIGVYLVDLNRRIVFWNAAAERITGYLAQEVIGHLCNENLLMDCDQDCNILCASNCPLENTIRGGRPLHADLFLLHKEGQRLPVQVSAVPLRNETGACIGSAEFFKQRSFAVEGIRDRRKPNYSRHAVTGLLERAAMQEMLAAAVHGFSRGEAAFGILQIALDDLERLRHIDGRQAVNAMMYACGQTIAGSIRPSDAVAFWQDGHFLALINCPSEAGLASCAERTQHLVRLASVPWWGDRLSATVSIGGTMARAADTAEALAERAGHAVATALARGPGSIVVL